MIQKRVHECTEDVTGEGMEEKCMQMDDWNPHESWKKITFIMMIHASHQNNEITIAAQCSLNTVKKIRHELENCDGDYMAVARRKQHNRRFDCIRTAEFLENLQKKSVGSPRHRN